MRIAYTRDSSTLRLKSYLDERGIENYLPMDYKEDFSTGHRRIRLMPAINSLIFIRLDMLSLSHEKRTHRELLPLRYYMRHHADGSPSEIIHVPDRQMEDFMRVTSSGDERVMYLGDMDFSHKIGRRVRITQGIFRGVEGTVYRVKKDRRVVVAIPGVTSVAISCLPPDCLEDI